MRIGSTVRRAFLGSLLVIACLAADRVAITPRRVSHTKSGPNPDIRIDIKLTLIPVTVTDTLGAPYLGLPKTAFRLWEDGVEQEIKSFGSEDGPVSLGVVFDASRSMTGKLDQSRAAVSQFFRTATNGDEFFLIEFNDTPRMLCDFTTDTEEIERKLVDIKPRNWTALFDSVYMAIRQMRHARNPRKALLILSDGGDNNSRYTESEMKSLVREADVSIYSIGLLGGGFVKRHAQLLRQLSEDTGGHYYQVDKIADLPEAVERVSAALRQQYLLGYSPTNAENNGMYRKIEVQLSPDIAPPRLRASWRTGYYAPAAW